MMLSQQCPCMLLLFTLFLAPSVATFFTCNNNHNSNNNISMPVFATRPLVPSSVTATTFSESNPIPSALFGNIAPKPASAAARAPSVHPRIVFDQAAFSALVARYADNAHFGRSGSWARHQRDLTLIRGPTSPWVLQLAAIGRSGATYGGERSELSANGAWSDQERAAVWGLASLVENATDLTSGGLFLCAVWALVDEKRRAEGHGGFLEEGGVRRCVDATVGWANVVLAHRAHSCNPDCGGGGGGRAWLWVVGRKWELQNDWYTGGIGLALSYDVLYGRMAAAERRVVRSALAMLVMQRFSWGNGVGGLGGPDASVHPHRIYSNWAMYHSNLYLTNLAIEGETNVDVYTRAVLDAHGEASPFNAGLDRRYAALIKAFLAHSVYPDGSTYEDGYTYHIAMREGSLGFLAAHRRGIASLDTPRFRNLIHNLAQLNEPWRCGAIVGHASGGGLGYPAYLGLFRYAYPDGAVPAMLWRQRMGSTFTNNAPCRIDWNQNMVQLTILGGEHTIDAESPQGLPTALQQHIPLSFHALRRGLLIARGGLQERAVYVHFDARPDAFFVGHDNADRGVFTFSALRRTWIADLPWAKNLDSRRHSLVHVDGLAQDEKAPPVRMIKVLDDGAMVLAAADLSYAYNVQWARGWPDANPPRRHTVVYGTDGNSSKVTTLFTTREYGDPRHFGWPAGDTGADIGMERPQSNLHGDPDQGFQGMWTWKRAYRPVPLAWAVRSIALVRSSSAPGYFLVTDSFRISGSSADHTFESYLILGKNIDVDVQASSCTNNQCFVVLGAGASTDQTDIHVLARGSPLTYLTELFDGNRRLIFKTSDLQQEQFWMAFNPHNGDTNGFAMTFVGSTGLTQINYEAETRFFRLSATNQALEVANEPPLQSTAPSSSPSVNLSPSASQSTDPVPSASQPGAPSAPASSPSANPSAFASASNSPAGSSGGLPSPMTPVKLTYRVAQSVPASRMSSNRESFLHPTTGPLQIVFKFTSKTLARRRKGDRLQTCMRYTNVRVQMAVYYCGAAPVADVNYAARSCSLVEESGAADSCERFKTDVRRTFTTNAPYFVAVSVEPPAGVSIPRFRVKHVRSSLS